MGYTLSDKANRDILSIWFRIAHDSEETADHVEETILHNYKLLGESPGLGRIREDLTHRDIRVWPAMPYENYRIAYRIRPDGIQILRVIQAARRKVWRRIP